MTLVYVKWHKASQHALVLEMGDIMFVEIGNFTSMELRGSMFIEVDVMFMEVEDSMFMEVGGTMLTNP